MARLKTKEDRLVRLSEEDYKKLLEDSMVLRALKIAGIEEMPIYNAVRSILEDKHVELGARPAR